MKDQTVAPPLTFAVCSNKQNPDCSLVEINSRLLLAGDDQIYLFDSDNLPTADAIHQLEKLGNRVLENHTNLGLSVSRNRVIDQCRTRYIVFLDDDVTLSAPVVTKIREAFRDGHGIVGARLEPPPDLALNRWYISPSQYHYLSLHRPDRPATVWGACMGIDVEFAQRHGLLFQDNLGRKGGTLLSGEDTTFLRRMRLLGAREKIIDTLSATHHLAPHRLNITYLIRRAFWQGRSEVRRCSSWNGFMKEVNRNFDGSMSNPGNVALAIFYSVVVFSGVLCERLMRLSGKTR